MDGSTYNGQFVDGMRQGQGVYKMSNGDIYTGYFDRDEMHGAGELMQSDGTILQATWNHNRKEGQGFRTDSSGRKYAVIFYNDMQYNLSDQNPDCWNMPLNFFLFLLRVGITTINL